MNRRSHLVLTSLALAGLAQRAMAQDPGDTSKPEQLLEDYYQEIIRYRVAPQPQALLGRPVSQLMFHGSAIDFSAVEPRPNERINANGSIAWSGTAIFGAMDPRVGLHYTASRVIGFGAGIDLISPGSAEKAIVYFVYGGSNRDEALDAIYGQMDDPSTCRGYLHVLDKSKFVRETGLGHKELITRDASANLGRFVINRRAAIDALVRQGSIRIEWAP